MTFSFIDLFSYNGGTCVSTTNAYICQCTYPFSGSNCELTVATRAPQPVCACILCPCPTPVTTVTNPCSLQIHFDQRSMQNFSFNLGLPNPCQNNGGCSVVQNTPQCHCQPTFTGYYCQYGTSSFLLIHFTLYLISISTKTIIKQCTMC